MFWSVDETMGSSVRKAEQHGLDIHCSYLPSIYQLPGFRGFLAMERLKLGVRLTGEGDLGGYIKSSMCNKKHPRF